ncbi:MAG: hypothetical protein LBD68_03320, partial [Zoogloeaceae bacterium]|nr:hypothetical protein [Zoogloeaceae bacterium]
MPPSEIPPEPGRKQALIITVAMHGLLVLALFLGVQWKTEYAPVEVELWSPTPRPTAALPRSNPPPEFQQSDPVPVKTPDIALRKDKKEEKK